MVVGDGDGDAEEVGSSAAYDALGRLPVGVLIDPGVYGAPNRTVVSIEIGEITAEARATACADVIR